MNRPLTAVFLLAFALNAAAQNPPGKMAQAPKSPKKEAAVAVSTKPAAAAQSTAAARPARPPAQTPGSDPGAEILEKLKTWDARLETLKADFTQEINFTEAGLKQTVEGNLRYVKPNLLRIEHSRPARQTVVTDKTDIWIYKPSDNQAVHTAWDSWRRTQDQNFSGILDFGNYSALTAKNTTLVTPSKDGGPVTIVFTPRSGAPYSLTLRLSPQDYFPVEAELSVEGTIIRTRLTAVEKNAAVDKEVFKFSPPKGVETLEFKTN